MKTGRKKEKREGGEKKVGMASTECDRTLNRFVNQNFRISFLSIPCVEKFYLETDNNLEGAGESLIVIVTIILI